MSPATSTSQPKHATGIDPRLLLDDYAHERVAYHVGRIGRMFRMGQDRREDLRQDFYLALCKAARRYDPLRATVRTFVSRVIELTAAFRRRCIRNERRCAVRSPLLISQLPHGQRSFAPLAPRSFEPAARDLAIDLAHGLDQVPDRQRRTAEALRHQKPSRIAADRACHPSTVYREIASLRCSLSELGMNPAH